jgi:hypothetical protein
MTRSADLGKALIVELSLYITRSADLGKALIVELSLYITRSADLGKVFIVPNIHVSSTTANSF